MALKEHERQDLLGTDIVSQHTYIHTVKNLDPYYDDSAHRLLLIF